MTQVIINIIKSLWNQTMVDTIRTNYGFYMLKAGQDWADRICHPKSVVFNLATQFWRLSLTRPGQKKWKLCISPPLYTSSIGLLLLKHGILDVVSAKGSHCETRLTLQGPYWPVVWNLVISWDSYSLMKIFNEGNNGQQSQIYHTRKHLFNGNKKLRSFLGAFVW